MTGIIIYQRGKSMIVDKDLQNLLTTNSMFNGVSREQLKSFIKPKNFVQIEDGKIIYSKEEPADEIYLIVQGEVKIKKAEGKNIEYKYITDYFGEEEVEQTQMRTSTAIANKDTILYKISSEELKNLTEGISQVSNNLNHKNSGLNQNSIPLINHVPDGLVADDKSQESINFDEIGEDINL